MRSGALTSLPVRIHRYDHLSDAGALCLTNDWRVVMKDGQDRKSNGSPCVVGNWGSFIWPERYDQIDAEMAQFSSCFLRGDI